MASDPGGVMPTLSEALGVNGIAICDCGHRQFFVGLSVVGAENRIKVLECAKCGHQLAVPFQTMGTTADQKGGGGARDAGRCPDA